MLIIIIMIITITEISKGSALWLKALNKHNNTHTIHPDKKLTRNVHIKMG